MDKPLPNKESSDPTIELARPEISVVIPAYNEERRLPPTIIDMIDFFEARGDVYEILVANDGSSDLTSEVVRKFSRLRPNIRLLELPHRGKGAAVRTAALRALGDTILMADADGATPIQELLRLERALASGADIAIGSRAVRSSETSIRTSLHRRLLGRAFNLTVNLLAVPRIADTQCGFKLFTRAVASFLFSNQRSDGFGFDVELLWMAQRVGLRIDEVPINWANIPDSKVNLIKDSFLMFCDVCRFRLWHRDMSPSRYSSRPGH